MYRTGPAVRCVVQQKGPLNCTAPNPGITIWDWPTPKNVTEVQSFVGFINFYHRFIPDFSHLASPLHRLTKKEEPWRWARPEELAFQELKTLVTSAPVLVLPNQDAHFRLETDTSSYATGAILSQLCDDEKWHPVGFTLYCMVTVRVDIFGIYIFGWEGVARINVEDKGMAQINVEDKGMAQINVVSPQVSGMDRPDHYGRIGPLWSTPNSE